MDEISVRELSERIGVRYATVYHWITKGVKRLGKLKPTRFESRGQKQDEARFSPAAVARIERNRAAGLKY